MDLITFYNFAKKVCISEGFKEEIQLVEERKFDQINSTYFFREYSWVVISSGISNKAATSVFHKLMETRNIDVVKHPGKNKALKKADCDYLKWFFHLQKCKTDKERIEYLRTLPYMGPATSLHLARNLGIDVAKPDRHLVKIANHFGYGHTDVQTMCEHISKQMGERVGTIDIVLWRISVIMPPWKQKEESVPGW